MALPPRTDVVVAGGGHAALCAAITAREAGARVLILEAAPRHMRGGNTRHTRNLRAMHEAPTATLTDAYPAEEYWEDLLRVTAGHTNERLARLMIESSGELVEWLMARGVRFQPALSGTLSLGRTNAFFLGGGKALLNALYLHAEAIGVDVVYRAEVRAVNVEGAEFRSVEVCVEERTQRVEGQAFVAAAGGFQANEAWMRDAWGPRADNFLIRGTPFNTGGVLRSLIDQGMATVGDPTQCHAVAIDARAPKFDGGIASRLDSVCFGIVVNKDGERFYDEGEDFWPKRYAIWGRLVAEQPEQIAYSIIDSKVTDNFMPSVFPSIGASSLEALAEQIDMNPNALASAVAQFNETVRVGTYDPAVLDDCGTEGLDPPKSHWALPIDTPPYFAYPLRPGITFTYLGLEVNEEARVLTRDGTAVRNLFAAGETMAGNILEQGYCAGTGMTIGGVFGRIAGKHAA